MAESSRGTIQERGFDVGATYLLQKRVIEFPQALYPTRAQGNHTAQAVEMQTAVSGSPGEVCVACEGGDDADSRVVCNGACSDAVVDKAEGLREVAGGFNGFGGVATEEGKVG